MFFIIVNPNTGKRLSQKLPAKTSGFILPKIHPLAGSNTQVPVISSLSRSRREQFWIFEYVEEVNMPSSEFTKIESITEEFDRSEGTYTTKITNAFVDIDIIKEKTYNAIVAYRNSLIKAGMAYIGPVYKGGEIVNDNTIYRLGTEEKHQNALLKIVNGLIMGYGEEETDAPTGFKLETGIVIPLPTVEAGKSLYMEGYRFVQALWGLEALLASKVEGMTEVSEIILFLSVGMVEQFKHEKMYIDPRG